jgi:hypothetical protein
LPVRKCAAARQPGSSFEIDAERWPVAVTDDEVCGARGVGDCVAYVVLSRKKACLGRRIQPISATPSNLTR